MPMDFDNPPSLESIKQPGSPAGYLNFMYKNYGAPQSFEEIARGVLYSDDKSNKNKITDSFDHDAIKMGINRSRETLKRQNIKLSIYNSDNFYVLLETLPLGSSIYFNSKSKEPEIPRISKEDLEVIYTYKVVSNLQIKSVFTPSQLFVLTQICAADGYISIDQLADKYHTYKPMEDKPGLMSVIVFNLRQIIKEYGLSFSIETVKKHDSSGYRIITKSPSS